MSDTLSIEAYADRWEDYFTYVNTKILSKLLFEDDLYIAYGSFNNLLVEDLSYWYKDAEELLVSSLSPDGYIAHKYGDHVLTEDDIDYFLDKEQEDGMLYKSGTYWFRA